MNRAQRRAAMHAIREAFWDSSGSWDGFWSVFRNPAVTYCIGLMIGFVGGAVMCVLIK